MPVLQTNGFRFFLENNVNQDKLNALYGGKFDSTGKMKPHFAETVNDLIQLHGIPKDKTDAILIPLTLELTIDGIGGIFPGNSLSRFCCSGVGTFSSGAALPLLPLSPRSGTLLKNEKKR